MQFIAVNSTIAAGNSGADESAQVALAGLITAIGESDFGAVALARLNMWMPLCWWSVYRVFAAAPPTMYASGSFEAPDGTQEAFHAYRSGLYRRDQTFAAAWERVGGGEAVITHWDAREIPSAHREQIYSRHGLRERVSLVSRDTEDGLLAVNLYRSVDQPAFSDAAIDQIRNLARPMLACVGKHLALLPGKAMMASTAGPLQALTDRERQVCERLLRGLTHEGIAADLSLSPATVKTYRDRAFRRLGIHHRNELFALAFGASGVAVSCLQMQTPATAAVSGTATQDA
ncbi:MAG: hypothetical protein RLY71_885 [Pseudomonadota bacterium]|jgi:DNA-binding CsgD family transcriptional regulator